MSTAAPGPTPRGHPSPNKLATVLWFAARPWTYEHLLEMLRRRATPGLSKLEATGPEANAWGGARGVSPGEALRSLLGPGEYRPLGDLFPDVVAGARARVRTSSVEMGGAAALDLLYHLVLGARATRVVETGVAYGWSSLAVLLALRELGGGTLASTDMPYPRARGEEWVGIAVPDDLRGDWRLVRRPDRPGLRRAVAEVGEAHLAHYDSDKTYAGRMWAYPLLWRSLRAGGLLVSDDIQDNLAFRHFAEGIGAEPLVVAVEGKLVGIVRKA